MEIYTHTIPQHQRDAVERLEQLFGPQLDPNSGERRRGRSANSLILFGEYGGADETRTRDLLRDRQLQKIYLVGPSSFVLRHGTRFWT